MTCWKTFVGVTDMNKSSFSSRIWMSLTVPANSVRTKNVSVLGKVSKVTVAEVPLNTCQEKFPDEYRSAWPLDLVTPLENVAINGDVPIQNGPVALNSKLVLRLHVA